MADKAPEQPNKTPAPAPAAQAVGPQLPRSAIPLPTDGRAQWVINDGAVPAVVRLFRASDNEPDEMFVQPGSRARIPAGYAFDRATAIKYPRVRLTTN